MPVPEPPAPSTYVVDSYVGPTHSTQAEPYHFNYNGLVVVNWHAPTLPLGDKAARLGYNPSKDAAAIYMALNHFNVDERACELSFHLINPFGACEYPHLLVISMPRIGILQMDALAECYLDYYGQKMVDHIDKKIGRIASGEVLHALAVGPLYYDIELLYMDFTDQVFQLQVQLSFNYGDLFRG
ncbi:hypothetical protein H0H87_010600 [Tephrocybe sp. NHM501043]|nr:hypothetical protein H0H87_010600 [Tephrocybe sp. NHM501043]